MGGFKEGHIPSLSRAADLKGSRSVEERVPLSLILWKKWDLSWSGKDEGRHWLVVQERGTICTS